MAGEGIEDHDIIGIDGRMRNRASATRQNPANGKAHVTLYRQVELDNLEPEFQRHASDLRKV